MVFMSCTALAAVFGINKCSFGLRVEFFATIYPLLSPSGPILCPSPKLQTCNAAIWRVDLHDITALAAVCAHELQFRPQSGIFDTTFIPFWPFWADISEVTDVQCRDLAAISMVLHDMYCSRSSF